jgi:hypothetical protein
MSDLEMRVQRYLKEMLLNCGSVTLDGIMQRDLARWAVIKVLLLERAMRQQGDRHRSTAGYEPSEAELAWLYAHPDPPPRSRVWLGAFDARRHVLATTEARNITSMPSPSGRPLIAAHLTTLTLGYVLLQVFSTDFIRADAAGLPSFPSDPPPPHDQAVARIWPTERSELSWPLSFVTPETLGTVVNWGQPSRHP